eukprot:11548161-Alexandrium_andersonii.AAC.1
MSLLPHGALVNSWLCCSLTTRPARTQQTVRAWKACWQLACGRMCTHRWALAMAALPSNTKSA